MNDDATLLRRYLDEGDEAAFTELVQKHVDLVYSAALRRTGGDVHRAADVAQEVFTALARQARTLVRHPAIGAWLHATTRNLAVNRVIADQRRERRHLAALELETAQPAASAPSWEQMRPVLDAAIDELPEHDRQSVVMRFLERRPFKEIGAALTISEDAARVRTDRALEKLRLALARRGITSTATALGTAVSTHGVATAPAGLGAALAVESLAATAGGTGLMAATTALVSAKLAITAAMSALVAFTLGFFVSEPVAAPLPPSAPNAAQSQAFGALSAENQRLKAALQSAADDLDDVEAAHTQLLVEDAKSPPKPAREDGLIGEPLPRYEIQRSVLNNLRLVMAARDQFQLENGRAPVSLAEIVGARAFIRRLTSVDGEDYTSLSMQQGGTLTVTTLSGVTVKYGDGPGTTTQVEYPPELARLRAMEAALTPAVTVAKEAYRLANRGKDPDSDGALLPFFSTPQQAADFLELLEARK